MVDTIVKGIQEKKGKNITAADVFAQQGIQFDASQWERFGSYFQMLPHVNSTDGFFAAVLQRD